MSEGPDKDQKTEAPTAKRKADAARNGDVLQSRELGTALVMLAGAGWLALAGPMFVDACKQLLKNGLSFGHGGVENFDPAPSALHLLGIAALPMALLFAVSMIATFAAPAMLGTLGFREGSLAFKANRMNPLKGLARIFGPNGVIELAKAMAKAAMLGAVGYWLVTGDLAQLFGLGFQDSHRAAALIGTIIVKLVLWLTLGLAMIAFIDVPVQIIRRNARLRMSMQEIKEENKQSEGSPELKQAVRQRQREILNNNVRKAVSEASVILTNPTHFAVALRYDPVSDFAPMVVARGREATALAIRELAQDKAVPVLEYPTLARAIYFTSRAGQPISEDLYLAVATVLAFVFNLDRAMAEGKVQPDVDIPPAKQFDETGVPQNEDS
jgi:flagellar biosynthesis protein FlhB